MRGVDLEAPSLITDALKYESRSVGAMVRVDGLASTELILEFIHVEQKFKAMRIRESTRFRTRR